MSGPISNKKKLAMGKSAPTGAAGIKKTMKKGGVIKGKEVAVKHVAMKKGGAVSSGAHNIKSVPGHKTLVGKAKMKGC